MMFEVEVKCGHVGKNHYILKTVPVIAENKKAAAAKARLLPRVKHDHPDAVRQVRVIDAPRYAELVKVHRTDLYFQCRSIQEQRELCNDLEIFLEVPQKQKSRRRTEPQERVRFVGKERVQNLKRYLKYYVVSEDIAA